MIATTEVAKMVQPWLTGNDERDAKSLAKTFRMVGLTLAQWRQVVSESKAEK